MSAKSTYAYRARTKTGEVVTGSTIAASADEVSARLRAEGKYIVSIDEHALSARAQLDVKEIAKSETAKRVRRDDVIAFAQQMSVMLETGVPLSEAIDAFMKQTRSKEFGEVLAGVNNDLHAGEPISTAMARWPRVFPTIMISLMKASEISGTMSQMLGRVGKYLAKERRTAKQIRGALSYPMFMLTIGIVVTVFLMTFVLPRFTNIYVQRNASLPLPTKILMVMSEFFTTQYLIYLPVLAVLSVGTYLWVRSKPGRRALDWLKLNAPILRTLFGQLYVTRAARTMSTLLAAGVSLLDVIDICRGVTSNSYWEDFWNDLETDIREGRQLADTLSSTQVISPNVASMIASGERSGRLSEVMGKVAEFSEEELDSAVRQATSFIEPVMICTMGVVIGGVAMALLLPIFTIGNVMSGT